jgi:ribosomal protein L10
VEQAELNRNIEIAKNAIIEGAKNEFITKITGLTIEQIEQLRNQTK